MPTAADSADGDSGVTPLDCRLAGRVVEAVFATGFRRDLVAVSLRILSTVFSVTGFSLMRLVEAAC